MTTYDNNRSSSVQSYALSPSSGTELEVLIFLDLKQLSPDRRGRGNRGGWTPPTLDFTWPSVLSKKEIKNSLDPMRIGEKSVINKSQGFCKTQCLFHSSHLCEYCFHTSIDFVNLTEYPPGLVGLTV